MMSLLIIVKGVQTEKCRLVVEIYARLVVFSFLGKCLQWPYKFRHECELLSRLVLSSLS